MDKRCLILFMVVFWIFAGTSMARGEGGEWVLVKPYGFDRNIWVRIVEPDETWQNVAREVQERIRSEYPGEEPRVGFYGHGGLVSPEEAVKNDLPFVAALGLVANMHVMIFPKLQFPEKPDPLRNLFDTTRAAVRITEGISTLNKYGMTPSYAGFSDGAEVIVKVGQVLKEGKIWDGLKDIPVSEDIRKDVYLKNILTFAYLFPKGDVTKELLQRVQGEFTNVVPKEFWKRWGNFQFSDKVNNFKLENAPSHGKWPHLKSSEDLKRVYILGSFLGGEKPSKLDLDRKADLSPFRDEQKKYVPWDRGGGSGGAIGTPSSPSMQHSPKPPDAQSGVAIIRGSLDVRDESISVNPALTEIGDEVIGRCPPGQAVCGDVPLPGGSDERD